MDETKIGAAHPEGSPGTDDQDDVEGHYLLPDPGISREMARAREAEIERRLQAHEAQAEAKRAPDTQTKK